MVVQLYFITWVEGQTETGTWERVSDAFEWFSVQPLEWTGPTQTGPPHLALESARGRIPGRNSGLRTKHRSDNLESVALSTRERRPADVVPSVAACTDACTHENYPVPSEADRVPAKQGLERSNRFAQPTRAPPQRPESMPYRLD